MKIGSALAICVGFVALTGCGSGARLEKQLADVKQELLRVQNDYDRLQERLVAVEGHETRMAALPPADSDRPPLKVVRMSPEQEELASAAEEPVKTETVPATDGPRPMIRGSGEKVYETGSEAPPPPSKGKTTRATSSGEKR